MAFKHVLLDYNEENLTTTCEEACTIRAYALGLDQSTASKMLFWER